MTIHHVIVFSVSAFLFLMSQFYRVSVAVIAPRLMSDLGIDTEGLSLMSAAFFYGFAFTQVPLAVFLDRIGARKTMATLNLVGVAGAITFAVSDSLALLTISRLMLGIGMASNLMGTFKLISVWFHPGRFATLTTMVVSLGTGGTLMATTPLALLLEAMGWRASFLLFAGINLFLTVILIIVVRDQPPKTVHPEPLSGIPGAFRQMISGLKLLFREKDYWIISMATLCRYGVSAAIQTLYGGLYLIKGRDLSVVLAGNILALMNIGMIIGGPVFGFISDRMAGIRKRVVIFGLLGMMFVLLVMGVLPQESSIAILFALFFLLGFFSSAGMIMFTHIKERMPAERAGASMTGINFFNMIGPAVFLQGLGMVIQRAYGNALFGPEAFFTAFLICAGALGVVALLYLLTTDT